MLPEVYTEMLVPMRALLQDIQDQRGKVHENGRPQRARCLRDAYDCFEATVRKAVVGGGMGALKVR